MILSLFTTKLERTLGIRPAAMRVIETIVCSVLVILVNISTGVITARLLGPEGRGELASILLGLQVASLLAIVGLPTSSIYHIKKDPGNRSRIVGSVFVLAVLFGSIAAVIAWWSIPHLLKDYSEVIVTAAQFMVLITPALCLLQAATPILRARDGFWIFNAVRLLPPLLTLLSLVLLAISNVRSPVVVSLAYPLAQCAILFWPLLWIWRDCQPRLSGNRKTMGLLLRFSARSLAVDVANTISLYIDRILLVYLLAPSAVGLYVVAVSMAQPLKEIGWAIALVLFPKASEYEPDQAIEISGLATRAGLLVMVAAGLPLVIIAPIFLKVLFGEEFLPATPVFRLLVIATIIRGTADIMTQAFLATGRPGIVSILRGFELVMLIALLVYLVPRFGLMGAAGAIIATAIVRFLSIWASFPLLLGGSPPRLYLNRSDFWRIRRARRTPAKLNEAQP